MQDCRESALPKNHSSISISDVAADEDVSMRVHTFESDAEHESLHKPKRLFEEIAKSGKSQKGAQPPTGTPSPRVRFGPPLGKKKDRIPPVKDSALVKLGPSPLSQSFTFTASVSGDTSSSNSRVGTSKEPGVATPASSQHLLAASSSETEVGTTTTSSKTSPSTPNHVQALSATPAATNNVAMALDMDSGSTTVSTTALSTTSPASPTSAAMDNTAKKLDADSGPTSVSTTALNAAYTPSTPAQVNDAAMELDAGAGSTTLAMTTSNATYGPSTLADDTAMDVDAGAGTTTLSMTTSKAAYAPSTPADDAAMELDATPGATTSSMTTSNSIYAPSTPADDAAMKPDAAAGATASPTAALNAAYAPSTLAGHTAMDLNTADGATAASTMTSSIVSVDSFTTTAADDAAMELNTAAGATATSIMLSSATTVPSSTPAHVNNTSVGLDAGVRAAAASMATLNAASASSRIFSATDGAATAPDVCTGPTTMPAKTPIHLSGFSAATGSAVSGHEAGTQAATASAVALDPAVDPSPAFAAVASARTGLSADAASTLKSMTTLGAPGSRPGAAVASSTTHAAATARAMEGRSVTSGLTAASKSTSMPTPASTTAPSRPHAGLSTTSAAAPLIVVEPPAAPAQGAPFTAMVSTGSILRAFASTSTTSKAASRATAPGTAPALTKPASKRPLASSSRSPPPSSPSSLPASLPPSPQGSPGGPAAPIKYGGAATVPDLSEIEATPPKGRKRRGSHAGKENSKEHASKRLKAAAAGSSRKRKHESVADGPNKRQCTAGSHSFKVAVPSGWAANALVMLTSQDLGPQWHLLLEAWLTFEEMHGFNEKKKPWLSSSGRPEVVGQWIKRGRSITWRPDAGTCANVESEFSSWWRSLQPSWRGKDSTGLRRNGGGDWDVLRCSGINGFLSVIAALFFWAHNDFDSAPSPAWDTAVGDVLYALQMLAKSA